MPLCGGTKTVQRKLVLLYVNTNMIGKYALTAKQRRWCLRQDFFTKRVYARILPHGLVRHYSAIQVQRRVY